VVACFRTPQRPHERQLRLVELFLRESSDFVENALRDRSFQEGDRHKNDAIATVAHELRNPLGVIVNATHILESAAQDRETLDELRTMIVRQAKTMTRLVEDLIDTCRDGRGRVEIDCESSTCSPYWPALRRPLDRSWRNAAMS